MKKVAIVQRVLPHYREPFFRNLKKRLARDGIELVLFYGQEYPGTVPKSIDLNVEWAHKIYIRYFKMFGIELTWQPCLGRLRGADLVIVEQANRLLLNYLLLLRILGRRTRLAYWGHGRNMQRQASSSLRETLKRMLSKSVDWWFAYTTLSADFVVAGGFPRGKTTVVQNAIDTKTLAEAIDTVTGAQVDALRTKLGINIADHVCLFCGGMHDDKKLDFLLEACEAIHARVPKFHLVMIGEGPEQAKVEAVTTHWPWVHYVGPVYGAERAVYFRLAKALLMPGPVGLVILDCFIAKTPLFTTNLMMHGPEIAYLEESRNGVMTDFSIDAYAGAVASYLCSDRNQEILMQGCAESAQLYTMKHMVENFAIGVKACLADQ